MSQKSHWTFQVQWKLSNGHQFGILNRELRKSAKTGGIIKKTIAVFTGNRAEYGILVPVIRAINNNSKLDYRLIVSGAHLDPRFGDTLSLIEKDGFKISAEVKIDLEEDNLVSTAKAIGNGIVSMVEVLNRIKPDMLVVYADRFEGFAAIIAASQMGIPVAHIEGGDVTEGGALDDSIRHAMTKLSHIHFATNSDASRRIVAMGEEEWRVFNTGLPSIDRIISGDHASPEELKKTFELDTKLPLILFTQHSVTTEFQEAGTQIKASLEALERIATKKKVQTIITSANNDAGGEKINRELKEFERRGIINIQFHSTLGSYNYHGILAMAQDPEIRVVCVGNSSSGIKETAVFGCPTINIGTRQQGRLRAENVLDVGYVADDIYEKLVYAIEDDDFRHRCRSVKNPYGVGNSGQTVAEVLSKITIDKKLIQKKMMV